MCEIMKTFDDLKNHWKEQSQPEIPKDGANTIIKKIDFIRRKQRITNGVLLTTTIILIVFFFYIEAYNHSIVSIGLLLMIGTLLLRVSIEYFSIKKLKQLDVTKDAVAFKTDMITYYSSRLKTHYIVTPGIIFLYAIGFYLLLPGFKESLSKGFYTYVWVSAIVILFILGFFIAREIRKELKTLKQLTQV